MKAKFTLTFRFLLLFTCAIFLQNASAQTTISLWNYEPVQGPVLNPTPNTGSGSSAVVNSGGGSIITLMRTGMTGTGCGDQNGSSTGAWAFEPFAPGSNNESNGAQFLAGTSGFQNIKFTWDQRWSNTAPNTARLQYTLNGLTWTNFSMTAANTTFCNGSLTTAGTFEANAVGDKYRRISVDFTAITGANNNPNFGVRVLAAHYRTTGQFRRTDTPTQAAQDAGTWRFDNVRFEGTLIPGPNPSVISGSTSYCAGGSANISVSITGGLGPFTLVYTNGTTNYSINNYVSGTNILVSPTTTQTYTIVSVTNANGVAGTGNSGSAVITVNPLPAVPLSANIATCGSGAVALPAGSPSGGVFSIPNPYSGPTITFTYTYTNANGCSRTSSLYTFTRNIPPAITTQPSTATQTVCAGSPFSPVSISATGSALTYQWYSNTINSTTGGTQLTTAAQIANGSKTDTYTPLSTTTGTLYYYVIVSGPSGCTAVKSANATGAFIVIPSTTSGSVSSPQTICGGTSPNDLSLSGQLGAILKWEKALDAAFTLGVQDIANTSTTLTSAQIGNLAQTTYFRAVVQNGGCAIVFTAPIEILIKSTTWNGSWSNGIPDNVTSVVFAANYSSSGDIEACSVNVTSGNVVFNPNHTLRIQNGLTVSGGTMTFEDKASLVQVNDVSNSGVITYKRTTTPMRRYDYTYWSSPVDAQILANLSPLTLSDKYFWWNTAIYNWSSITAPGITLMDIGKGYIIRAPQSFSTSSTASFEGSFIGTPNNGDYTVPIIVSGSDNMNLIGNPYPSALSADAFMSDPANAASIGTGSTIYLWTHNTPITSNVYISSDYAAYNFSGGVGTTAAGGSNNNIPTGNIAAGQSFFIKGRDTGSATFKNSMRPLGNNGQFFRPGGLNRDVSYEKNRVWLELTNGQGAFKQMLVGYIEGATNGFEVAYDGESVDSENAIGFYSLLDSLKLTIQGRALPFDAADRVALGYKATAGAYQIGIGNFDGLFHNQDIFLEDTYQNIIFNLKAGGYSFTTESGAFNDRFILRFTDDNLSNGTVNHQNQFVIYKGTSGITVQSGAEIMDSVGIYDAQGRIIAQVDDINSSTIVLPQLTSNAVVILKITTGDGSVYSRKYMN